MKTGIALSMAALALTAVPLASHAAPGDRALDACVKAFVENYLPTDRVIHVTKSEPAPGPLDAYVNRGETKVALSARGMRSGELLAQARCVANAHGVVVVLDDSLDPDFIKNADFAAFVLE